MSNTEIAIGMNGEIVLGHALFTRELSAAVSPDEWQQLLTDIVDADLNWASSRRRSTPVFGWLSSRVEGIPMQRILFCAAGALTALAATAAQSSHGAHAQTVDESTIFGVVMMRAAHAPECIVFNEWRPAKDVTAPGASHKVVYSAGCTKADIENHEQRWARAVRERLGDPGKH